MVRLLCILTLVSWLVACDNDAEPTASQVPPQPTERSLVMQFTGHHNGIEHQAAQHLADTVKVLSQDSLTLQLQQPDPSISGRELLAALQQGRLDLAVLPSAALSHIRPDLELFDIPFMFDSPTQVHSLYQSPLAYQLLEKFKDDALVGLAFWHGGFKQLVTTFPLNTVSDLNGHHLRILESSMSRQLFQQWGANTYPIAHDRIEEAFKNQHIDGEEDTAAHHLYHMDGKHLYLTNHSYQTSLLLMSEQTFSSLSQAQRSAIKKAVRETAQQQFALSTQRELSAKEQLKNQGISLPPPPGLIQEMKQAHAILLEKNRPQLGSALVEQFLQTKTDWTTPPQDKLIVALDAALTGSAANSGLAIRRGIELAIEEINAAGGLLGKEVVLLARDNAMIPSRGLDNLEIFSGYPNLLGVFSGISSPVVLSEIDLVHQKKLLMLVPWAAATPIVSNGRDPNYVFRLSVRDDFAADFLLEEAMQVSNRIGFLLVNNGWGRSNYHALIDRMRQREIQPVHTEWFDWGEKSIQTKIDNLIANEVNALIFIGNAIEGKQFIDMLASYPNPPVVISHWGITGSEFGSRTAKALEKVDLRVLQTFTFINNDAPKARELASRYHQRYFTEHAQDIVAPSGTAHAYDLMKMLAMATERAGTPDMSAIRIALKQLERYDGVMKTYQSPFSGELQEALDSNDYLFAFFNGDALYPRGPVSHAK